MNALGLLAHVAVCLGVSYAVVSLVAYAIHRWPAHDPRWRGAVWPFAEIHLRHALHHRSFPMFDRAAHADPADFALDIDSRVTAAMIVLLAAPALLFDTTAAVAMAAAIGLHNHVYNAIHREMHAPEGRWFAGSALYGYYRWRHFLHHRHPGTEFDSAFPFGDWLLGTHAAATDADRRMFAALGRERRR